MLKLFGKLRAQKIEKEKERFKKKLAKLKIMDYEGCVECMEVVPRKEALENAEWLKVEIKRPIDKGPICGSCARRLKSEKD